MNLGGFTLLVTLPAGLWLMLTGYWPLQLLGLTVAIFGWFGAPFFYKEALPRWLQQIPPFRFLREH